MVYSVQWFTRDSLLWGAVLKRRDYLNPLCLLHPFQVDTSDSNKSSGTVGLRPLVGLLIPFQLDNNPSGRWPLQGCKPLVRGLEEKSDSSSRMRT